MLGKKKTVKDHIISILSHEWPLSTKKIYNILTKKYQLEVSYQACHKALRELMEQNVIVKNGKEYQLSLEWAKQLKEFGERVERQNESSLFNGLPETGMKTFSFQNLRELYVFLLDLLERSSDQEKNLYQNFYHLHTPLAFTEDEYRRFATAVAKFENGYTIGKCVTGADKMMSGLYQSMHLRCHVKIGVNMIAECDLFICGDIIFQIFLSDDIKRMMDKIYRVSKNMDPQKLRKKWFPLFVRKTKIIAILLKNKELAEYYKGKILKTLRKK